MQSSPLSASASPSAATLSSLPRIAAQEPQHIAAALREYGAVVVPGILPSAVAAERAAALAALPLQGGDIPTSNGKSDLLTTLFNRDPGWLRLLDPPGVIEALESCLGADCHIVNQKGWRGRPGHAGWSPHVDALFVPMPEELCSDPRFTPPLFIVSALTYLCDIDQELAPTFVWPKSHRSGRSPTSADVTWRGQGPLPVLCKAGDTLLFRCDAWHSGSDNRTTDRIRYVVETAYAQRSIAQKFWPYLDFQLNPATRAAASARHLRLLGQLEISSYG